MTHFLFGHSTLGLAIQGIRYPPKVKSAPHRVLILGGVHGDEIEGVVLAQAIISKLSVPTPLNFELVIVPQFNIDGVHARTRGNANGVDLNRNLPTKDWSPVATTPRYQPGPSPLSEIENKNLVAYIEREKPTFIASLHSWKPLLNINDPAGSDLCHRVASRISHFTKYPIEPTIGYSTPGCLGTYAGFERGIPTLTYEIERGLDHALIIKNHCDPLLEGLRVLE